MHPALHQTQHRPWPLPAQPWTWRQKWHNLLFAHWPVPATQLEPLVPAGLTIQEFDGTAWVGVVPFGMTGVMRRPLPDIPGLSDFPELNVRLYVERDGKPGVWFLSLDAGNSLAVWAARRFFHLPYWRADIKLLADGDRFHYHARRRGLEPSVEFQAEYGPISPPYHSVDGTLEKFLTERYCLYSRSPAGKLFRCDVHHAPWPLQKADASIDADRLLATHGLSTGGQRPLLHYSAGVDVVVWSLEPMTQ